MLNDDLEKAYSVLIPRDDCDYNDRLKEYARNFLYFYLFSNEDLSNFFDNIDVNNKQVLTVGSSGDQAIYSLMHGASKVIHFDLNPFSKYYFDFKVAMIKNLSFKEFVSAYNVSKNPGTISPSLYAKISHDISDESRFFWDTLFLDGFGTDYAYLHFIGTNEILYKKKEYEQMQNFFNNHSYSIEFVNCNLLDINKNITPDQTFDIIMLSNIYDYIIDEWKQNPLSYNKNLTDFKNSISFLRSRLNKNGQIQIDYVWDDIESKKHLLSNILDLNNIYVMKNKDSESGSLIYAPNGFFQKESPQM